MSKLDALNLVLSASAVICLCSCLAYGDDSGISMRQRTVQRPYADQKTTERSIFQLISFDQASFQHVNELDPDWSAMTYPARADFSRRLQGGILLRFEFGLIIVKPMAAPETLQPTALTTDAIITASVRSKLAGESQLSAGNFEIQTDDGVVTIHAKGESLDQAAEMINLALGVPDVRQIVYTVGKEYRSSGVAGVQEFNTFGGQSKASPEIKMGNPSRMG
jgi:hypothetical protein